MASCLTIAAVSGGLWLSWKGWRTPGWLTQVLWALEPAVLMCMCMCMSAFRQGSWRCRRHRLLMWKCVCPALCCVGGCMSDRYCLLSE